MKKKVLILSIILIIIVSILLIFRFNNNKFYLSSEYYNKGEYIDKTSEEINTLIDNKESFLLFTYNSYCTLSVPCDLVFKEAMNKKKIDIVQIPFSEFKNTVLYKEISFAPSIIIIKKGKIVDYLKADKDEDLDKYQNSNEFLNWLNNYIYFK